MSISTLNTSERQALKYLACTNLYVLGKDLLHKDFVANTHQSMCDFYVRKDPATHFKEFAQAYPGAHDRIQLVPRNTYKSTIKVIDNVQWILNYPEIRILTVTADKELATAFIDQLTRYFTVQGKAERNPETNLLEGGRWTEFQELFKEHCISESEAVRGEFITPARKFLPANLIEKEPTAGTISMEGTSSGWHCDVLDYDDPISDRNSESGNRLEQLSNRMAMIFELLMNYGFRHIVATRYQPSDPYGILAETHGIRELYGEFESDGLKYMCKPALWLKGEPYKQPDYKMTGFPRAEEVDLFFPEGAPYGALKKKFKNKKTFYSQQLNNPFDAAEMPFTEELVKSCFIDHTALPKTGVTYAAWDLALSTKAYRDYTVGIIGMIDEQRRWWIINIIRSRFDFSEKCFQIVNSIRNFRPIRTAIEDVQGAQASMVEPLYRLSKTMNTELNIDWVPIGRGNGLDAKYIHMCSLHSWMTSKRIFFLNTIDCLDDLVKEFVHVGRRNSSIHDDIPDAVAHLVKQYSGPAQVSVPMSSSQEQWAQMRESEFEQLMFRRGKYAPGSNWDRSWAPAPKEKPNQFIDPMTGLPSPYPI